MGWNKQYTHLKPDRKAFCDSPTKMLKKGWRMIIDENETQYLIQFASGAAHWYSKSRFSEPIPVNELTYYKYKTHQTKRQQPQPQANLNKLF